jgi:hypothetical protein
VTNWQKRHEKRVARRKANSSLNFLKFGRSRGAEGEHEWETKHTLSP